MLLDRFSAGNGSSVDVHGKADVLVFLCLWDRTNDVDVWKKAHLPTLVGETRHNNDCVVQVRLDFQTRFERSVFC